MYRTATQRGTPDTIVVCKACGVRSNVALEQARHDSFVCSGCATEQPVLRASDDVRHGKVRLVDQQAPGPYAELEPFLQSLGASGKNLQVSVECDGIRILVALSVNSGVVMGVDLAAAAPGLPTLTLMRENMVHRHAKSKGFAREAQTGDAAFDEAVYIESKLRDQDVLAVLAAPAVRLAVMRLLDSADKVLMGGGYVKVEISKTKAAFDPGALHERLAWLRVVAGAPRPMVAQDAPVPRAAIVARFATFLFAPVGLSVGIYSGAAYGPVATSPYLVGALGGLVLAALIHPIFRRALSGRSTSHREILTARFASLVSLPFFVAGALFIYNGVMDRSPERVVVMKVVSSAVDDDDASKVQVTAVDEVGGEHSYTFVASRPTAPAHVSVPWRSGALGWTWQSGHATLAIDGPGP